MRPGDPPVGRMSYAPDPVGKITPRQHVAIDVRVVTIDLPWIVRSTGTRIDLIA